ncbi:hypothetical protein P9A16_33835 [Shinella sp. 838]|uniref:hypothetical protein n=1 Tax=Shinella sp. 838 TaxID=3038164 RepID=UPI00241542B0|nr:hypothetical protein [Shinella sp. 838]MDG4676072.1 hypothetical protein [Shinella sp. 838]
MSIPTIPQRPRGKALLSLALLATSAALVPELAYAQSAAPVEGILAALMHSTGRFGDERQAFAGCATPQASFASRRS